MGINFTVNIVPAVLSLIAIVPVLLYPITEKKYEAIRERLQAKQTVQA